jgi:hypothetical protein
LRLPRLQRLAIKGAKQMNLKGTVELEANLPPGRLRFNVRTPSDRVIAFRPEPAKRPPSQPTEQYEAEWCAYWQQHLGETILFDLNRNNAVVDPQLAPQASA